MSQGTQANPALCILLRGRVERVTQRDGASGKSYRTLLRTPAPDSYTSPGTFEVRSLKRIGAQGDEVEVECSLLGYGRTYDDKEGNKVHTAEHVLQAV